MNQRRPFITVILVFALMTMVTAVMGQKKIRIACVGNSITAGGGVPDGKKESYPAQLQNLLGNAYEVNNFGVGGATLLKKGNQPYWQAAKYQQALQSLPDLVFIKMGTNDSKMVNRPYLGDFEGDLQELIRSFAELKTHPRIVLLLPIAAFTTDSVHIYDPVIRSVIIPHILNVAYQNNLEVIDLHSLFADKASLVPDKIHPNAEGYACIARRLYELIRADRDTAFDIFEKIPVAKHITSFQGYACADFVYAGRDCKVVRPRWSAPGHPWIWRARFWGHEPQTDVALLERGYHLVYCDVAELFGNKEAIAAWDTFYSLLHKAGLGKKAALEGMSRGGVYIYNWAARNPKKVACIYADNPVLDLKSWPGGKGRAPGSPADWQKVIADYQLLTETAIADFHGSPIDKVRAIAKGGYPMLHVCGDADEIVPMEENTIPFEQAIKEQGGLITVIHKPGFHHHPHSLPNPEPIVDFILKAVAR